MAFDALPTGEVILVRGANTPAGQGAFDGWRADLPEAEVVAPGGDYWPYVDHYATVEAVVEALESVRDRALLVCHSFGGNVSFQALRSNPELTDRVLAIVNMASPLKLGLMSEPTPKLEVPVVSFRAENDGLVAAYQTTSAADTAHYSVACGHFDFLSDPGVRHAVLNALRDEMAEYAVAA